MKSSSTEPALQRAPGPGVARGQVPWVRAADGGLVFTGQITAGTFEGDARRQAGEALDRMDGVLRGGASSLARVARLTAYVAADADVAAVESVVGDRCAQQPVAFTMVRTPLAAPGAKVAFEAVAATTEAGDAVKILSEAALLPAGGKIFISGQAEKGPDLGASVRLTMAGLLRSLDHLGLAKTDVVQVKAFIRPFGDHAAAAKEVRAAFDGGPVPPVILIEWQSDLFAEIELVASDRSRTGRSDGSVSQLWLPWLPKSPRYSSAGRVAAGTPLIFIGAVEGGAGDARTQVKETFARLGSTLFEAGSGFRALIKATYYLGQPAARTALGEIRDVYFDPTRPPAASALNVASLGKPDRALLLDMIAAPLK